MWDSALNMGNYFKCFLAISLISFGLNSNAANPNITLKLDFNKSFTLNSVPNSPSFQFDRTKTYNFTAQNEIKLYEGKQNFPDDAGIKLSGNELTSLGLSIRLPLDKGIVRPYRPKSINANNKNRIPRSIAFIFTGNNSNTNIIRPLLSSLTVRKKGDTYVYEGSIDKGETVARGRFELTIPATVLIIIHY